MRITIAILASLLLLPSEAALAQACNGHVSEFTFTEENDAIAAFSGSDEAYTQGLRLGWSFVNHCGPVATLDKVGEWLNTTLSGENIGSYVYGLEFGQNFFTPNDISVPQLIEDDRPYAAWLYLGTNISVVDNTIAENTTWQHQFELQVGIVGPEAQGKWVQTEFHKLIDDELPQGWGNQLDTELGAQLYYTYQNRWYKRRYFDLTPGVVAGFGSIQDLFGLNLTARLGTPNRRAFPVSLITSTVKESAAQARENWEAFAFVGAEGRAMFHNFFLDGNNFKDSHSVDKEGFVYDLKAGFSVRYKSWRLSYTFIRRSREFSPDPVGVDAGRHDYGSLSITWEPEIH